jgi:hypothetical protein
LPREGLSADVGESSIREVQRRTRPGLPIPALREPAGAGMQCWVTPVDRNGRLANRSAVAFLGWSAGRRVGMTTAPGPIVVVADGEDHLLDARGHVSLSLAARRRCRIATGDRVLVIADRQQGGLLVIPMGVVHEMVDGFRRRTLPGTDR